MRARSFLIGFKGMALAGLVLGLTVASGLADEPWAELVRAKCGLCHSLDKTCKALGNDRAYWEQTMQRMLAKGTDMTPEQGKSVTAWLIGLAPGEKSVCAK